MKLDMIFRPSGDFAFDAAQIQQAQALGFDAAWSAESAHNPFFPLTLAAKTADIQIGTQTAFAFPRSPMVTAQIAWDLAKQSNGRFMLGLGTQPPGHQPDAAERMREYIESLRAIWNTFQTDARLRYRGQYYQFRLMLPFFNPGPIKHPDIPIYITGINPLMCQLAGDLCHGLHIHGFHTLPYLKAVVLPAVARGLAKAGRKRASFALTAPVFIVSGKTPAEMQPAKQEAKARIALYASAPAHQAVMSYHGWDKTHSKLRQMAAAGEQAAMPPALPDEMLNEIAIIAPPEEVAASIQRRYAGLIDRICLEWPANQPELMKRIAADSREMNQT